MADTSAIRDMLQDFINDRPEQAQVNFHNYITSKMKDLAGTQRSAADDLDTDIIDPNVDDQVQDHSDDVE